MRHIYSMVSCVFLLTSKEERKQSSYHSNSRRIKSNWCITVPGTLFFIGMVLFGDLIHHHATDSIEDILSLQKMSALVSYFLNYHRDTQNFISCIFKK